MNQSENRFGTGSTGEPVRRSKPVARRQLRLAFEAAEKAAERRHGEVCQHVSTMSDDLAGLLQSGLAELRSMFTELLDRMRNSEFGIRNAGKAPLTIAHSELRGPHSKDYWGRPDPLTAFDMVDGDSIDDLFAYAVKRGRFPGTELWRVKFEALCIFLVREADVPGALLTKCVFGGDKIDYRALPGDEDEARNRIDGRAKEMRNSEFGVLDVDPVAPANPDSGFRLRRVEAQKTRTREEALQALREMSTQGNS